MAEGIASGSTHPVAGLHVTELQWAVEPASQVAPVVREHSVENADVRIEMFLWIIFDEPLELTSQLCGLLQQILESRGSILQNSVYKSSKGECRSGIERS